MIWTLIYCKEIKRVQSYRNSTSEGRERLYITLGCHDHIIDFKGYALLRVTLYVQLLYYLFYMTMFYIVSSSIMVKSHFHWNWKPSFLTVQMYFVSNQARKPVSLYTLPTVIKSLPWILICSDSSRHARRWNNYTNFRTLILYLLTMPSTGH